MKAGLNIRNTSGLKQLLSGNIPDIPEHEWNKIVNSYSVMKMIANSATVMNAVANSTIAMNAVANSATARDAIRNSATAWDIVANNVMAIGKFVVGEAGLNPADYADMNAIANSATAMNAVANSATAMNAVANSTIAMNAVANSTIAMNAVANSTIAMNAVANSATASSIVATTSFIDTVVNSSTAKPIFFNSEIAVSEVVKAYVPYIHHTFADNSIIDAFRFVDSLTSDTGNTSLIVYSGTPSYINVNASVKAIVFSSTTQNTAFFNTEFLSRAASSTIDASISGVNDLSISAWIYLISTDCVIYNTGGVSHGFAVGVKNLVPYVASQNTDSLSSFSFSYSLNTNTWYHFVFSYNAAANTITVYIDGINIGSFTFSVLPGDRFSFPWLGSVDVASTFYDDNLSHYNDCYISLYIVFYRTLSHNDALFLYNTQKTPFKNI